MNQQTYDTMTAARDAGTMSPTELQDYNALSGAGYFAPFQAPQGTQPYVSPPAVPLTMTGTLDTADRPPVEAPEGGVPGQPYTGGTVPRGLSYEQTQRDFTTSLGDRLSLEQLHPADIGQLGQGYSFTNPNAQPGELMTRSLYRDPTATPLRSLERIALHPSAVVGAAVESRFGRPAGDQAQYMTNVLIPSLLLARSHPKVAGGVATLGMLGDYVASHVMRAFGR